MMPRRPGDEEVKPVKQVERVKQPKLAFRPAFKISDKTPESQVTGATSFNEMRQRLIDLGEMESR